MTNGSRAWKADMYIIEEAWLFVNLIPISLFTLVYCAQWNEGVHIFTKVRSGLLSYFIHKTGEKLF